jgi:hypothetical protein
MFVNRQSLFPSGFEVGIFRRQRAELLEGENVKASADRGDGLTVCARSH